jgi:methylphosphotriester-DNA--protein-cysteine methyltransferase
MFKKLFAGLLLGICLMSFSGIGISEGANEYYVGTKQNNKYHYASCDMSLMSKAKDKMVFKSVKEARAAGYKPCKICKPPLKD